MSRYTALDIEPKWQKAWDDAGIFTAKRDETKPKYYVLEMFPYPSGRIHMGHVRNYTMGDVISRYKGVLRLSLCCTQWAGMPLVCLQKTRQWRRVVTPARGPTSNIKTMKGQMKPLGLSIDWSREFATCDPEYYGQQQSMFIDFAWSVVWFTARTPR